MRFTNPREVASPSNSLMKVFRRALAEGTTKQGGWRWKVRFWWRRR